MNIFNQISNKKRQNAENSSTKQSNQNVEANNFGQKKYSFIILAENSSKTEKIISIKKKAEFYLHAKTTVTHRIPTKLPQNNIFLVAEKSLIKKINKELLTNVYCMDEDNDKDEGVNWHVLLTNLNKHTERKGINTGKTILTTVIRRLKEQSLSKTYIFGTGPSLGKYHQRDFLDGYRIVCNSIVKDRDTWDYIKPHILLAVDAVFHYGISPYANKFRADLHKRLLEDRNFVLVYPSLFHLFMIYNYPQYQHRFIPIPVNFGNFDINMNILDNFWLPHPENIITYAFLPIAATLTKNIFLWGFDGRKKNDKYFWSHSQKHNYHNLIKSVENTHPAFFNYYLSGQKKAYQKDYYGDNLDERLTSYELNGYSIIPMHSSTIKALNKRKKRLHRYIFSTS